MSRNAPAACVVTGTVTIATVAPPPHMHDAVNALVEAAVRTWRLPERVKRLVLPSYRYDAADFDHLQFAVARDTAVGRILGVAAWEDAAAGDCPSGRHGLLLHRLYVAPDRHGDGIGSRLLAAAYSAAALRGCDGLLVKAQRDARGFFERRGFIRLPVADDRRDYDLRYWLPMPAGGRLPATGSRDPTVC